jgi:hypothetical protein
VFIFIHSPSGLRILEDPYKKCCLYGPPTGGGGVGGVNFSRLGDPSGGLSGCEDDLCGWWFCRALLVFV